MTTQPTVEITYLGVRYQVSSELTVVRALESVGIRVVHGSGCRMGYCGACSLVYRRRGDVKLIGALACQTLVVDGMDICRLPSFPVHHEPFDAVRSKKPARDLLKLYPELKDCIECGACTEVCPQGIDVMSTVVSLVGGELETATVLSYECVSCALCAARCPASITPFTAANQARRSTAISMGRAPRLAARIEAVKRGDYNAALDELKNLSADELRVERRRALEQPIASAAATTSVPKTAPRKRSNVVSKKR
jgi:succinate dehydrogenase/fumarate reductase-like Fe-S protein